MKSLAAGRERDFRENFAGKLEAEGMIEGRKPGKNLGDIRYASILSYFSRPLATFSRFKPRVLSLSRCSSHSSYSLAGIALMPDTRLYIEYRVTCFARVLKEIDRWLCEGKPSSLHAFVLRSREVNGVPVYASVRSQWRIVCLDIVL